MCGKETLFISLRREPEAFFSIDGTWNDTKHRPMVCFITLRQNFCPIPLLSIPHLTTSATTSTVFSLGNRIVSPSQPL